MFALSWLAEYWQNVVVNTYWNVVIHIWGDDLSIASLYRSKCGSFLSSNECLDVRLFIQALQILCIQWTMKYFSASKNLATELGILLLIQRYTYIYISELKILLFINEDLNIFVQYLVQPLCTSFIITIVSSNGAGILCPSARRQCSVVTYAYQSPTRHHRGKL